ncbi:uncharacterized protein ISCGN_005830, partial [Ixodes scapularis]
STQLLTSLLQQFLTVSQRAPAPVQVTTLPDLSASLPTFSGDGGISARHWIEELERTQGLASWEPSTLLAVALGKLRGPAANWKAVSGRQCLTWDSFKAAFQARFGDRLTLLQWQHKVTALVQSPAESLVNYSLAKLKLISKCPVVLTDAQRIEYAVQGINDEHLATSITAQCPATVPAYMDIVTRLDQTLSHSRLRSNRTEAESARPPVAKPHATPSSTQSSNRAERVSAIPQRISSLSQEQQEARYLAITSKHGAPAHRPGQDLSKAVCYNCRQLGHLSAKCTAARTPRNQQPASFKTNAPAMSCLQNSEPLEGSMVQCAVVQADVPTIGKVDAFPDSGSKLTILSQELIGTLSLLPWTKPPIAVVGGSTVVPTGTLCTRISVGPISAVVEVMVLARNPLPLILGEDWFEAAHAELVVRPPNPTEIRHPSSGAVLLCQEKVLPRMSNAALLHTLTSSPFAPTIPSTGGLQLEPLPDDNQPLWLALACHEKSPQPERDSPKTCSPNSFESNKTSSILSEAQIGTELQPEETTAVQNVLQRHIALFATDDNDLGLYEGAQHAIDLVPDAVPYSRQPYRYAADDRQFIEQQTDELLRKGIIVPSSSPWAFPIVIVSRGSKKRLCVNYIPLNKQTVSVAQPLPRAEDIMDDIAGCSLFACLVLRFAYWQIRVRPEDQLKTSFITHRGMFQWTRMPLRLKSAPAKFQKAMQALFEQLRSRVASNGLVERSNGTLVSVLRKMCNAEPSRWEEKLSAAAFAVNTAVNATLQFSPFELLHGYVPKLPMEKFRRLGTTTLEARLLDLSERRSEAQQNSEQAQQRRKRRYDESHRHVTFTPGQHVWLRRQEPITDGTTKLAPTYKGPYQIIAQKTPVTYEIRRITNPADNSSRDERVAHSSQLKVFRPPYVDPTLLAHLRPVPTACAEPDPVTTGPTASAEAEPVTTGPTPSVNTELATPGPSSRTQRVRRLPNYLTDYDLSE